MSSYKIKKMPKLNLIPILDAIFIFIFFLLMSAQFIDIYEIGSDAPITTSIPQPKPDEEPLNLVLEIKNKSIFIKKGLDGLLVEKISETQLDKLNEVLIKLKTDYPKENTAIIKPSKEYEYHKVIKIIDHTRHVLKEDAYVVKLDQNNKRTASKDLFDKIIFETQD